MWGFQPHFRISLELLAERAMKTIGVETEPGGYLIGFANDDDSHWPICIEPEGRDFSPDVLAGASVLADELYENHAERGIRNSDPGTDKRFHNSLRDRCRARAIETLLEAADDGSRRRFFAGSPGDIEGYRVFPLLAIERAEWQALPRLSRTQSNGRIETLESLQYAVVERVLRAATRAMHLKTPPSEIGDDDANELASRAATDFVKHLAFVHGSWFNESFRNSMDAVAAQPYEGRTGVGRVLFGDGASWKFDLEFAKPIPVRDTRSFRKALEMTSNDLCLLTDGVVAFGLGELSDGYDTDTESCFDVTVAGRGVWELSHGATPLLRVKDGRANLPKARISESRFEDTVKRVFGPKCDPSALWSAASAAASQAHGTMLVILDEAAAEVERLATQGLAVKHTSLSEPTLAAITSIDGAVILAPDGECHGVGIILDGVAVTGVGDPSRGARFNSALRYAAAHQRGCMIVIVSEDGMINVLPQLPLRVSRQDVEDVVAHAESAANVADIDFEHFHSAERKALKYRFYFSQGQCDRLNRAVERVDEARQASSDGFIEIGRSKFTVDPDLDDGCFLD